jgi:hypothetical protein
VTTDGDQDQKWTKSDVPPLGVFFAVAIVFYLGSRPDAFAGVAAWIKVLVTTVLAVAVVRVWMLVQRRRRSLRTTE